MNHTQRPPGESRSLVFGIDGFTYEDLYRPERLRDLATRFYQSYSQSDPEAFARFEHYRDTLGEGMKPEEISSVIVESAPHLSRFIATMFRIEVPLQQRHDLVEIELPVFSFKRDFVTRRALKRHRSANDLVSDAVRSDFDRVRSRLLAEWFPGRDREQELATAAHELVRLERGTDLTDDDRALLARLDAAIADDGPFDCVRSSDDAPATPVGAVLDVLERWVALEHYAPSEETRSWTSLKTPASVDFDALVEMEPATGLPSGSFVGPPETYRARDGFHLTDRRYGHREVMNEVEYCVFCHERDRDSCTKGLFERDGAVRTNPLGIRLNGCPLDEKIGEMHYLKHLGDPLGALATIMIDNHLCPGTGHRICNDCMKACIYQKQEPVNIPQIETSVLTEVLDLPYGFEIYWLLTRWNPLRVHRPWQLPYNGLKVLVVGLGPAGYTLASLLLNEGFGVVGIDGLKIEPLPEELTGSRDRLPEPIRDWRDHYDELDERNLLGFGGVSEYGITVRWDKNFLKVIYIALARQRTFRIHGGVRFGGTMSIDDAWRMGFDHIAIATGAGKPTVVSMRNNLLRGIRKASDFLMALQLTGAYKPHALANLQLRLPAVVIGGGLTGIDTATEAMAYYPVLAERVMRQSERLRSELGEDVFRAAFTPEEWSILEEYIAHGRAIGEERERAEAEGRGPDFISLVRSWGGVSLVYRKRIVDAPAYRLNHEEIIKALQEGIYFIEQLSPTECIADDHGAVRDIVFERQALNENGRWRGTGETVTMHARSVIVAAGTSPNTMIGRETPGVFTHDKWDQYFESYVAETPTSVTQ